MKCFITTRIYPERRSNQTERLVYCVRCIARVDAATCSIEEHEFTSEASCYLCKVRIPPSAALIARDAITQQIRLAINFAESALRALEQRNQMKAQNDLGHGERHLREAAAMIKRDAKRLLEP